ncbi:MAG: transposase [Eubacteriales bacterium]
MIKGKISFYCKSLGVTRQGFHNYLKYKEQQWKYQALADTMLDICTEDECMLTSRDFTPEQIFE